MEIDIEEYKGQTIKYDDEADKFFCDITIEDKWKTSKRGSLKDLRKEIDLFIKQNLDFKPFKALLRQDYGKSFDEVIVKAIRTDKKLIVNTGGRDQQFSAKESSRLMRYDIDLLKEKEQADAANKEANRIYYERLKSLTERLKPIDLSKYDLA